MITPGTVLIEKDTLCPEFFHLVDGSYPNGLMSLTHSLPPYELERELSRAGWTFSYMASAIYATAFGFNRSKMMDAALKRITAQVRQQRCNCLEIDGVETHSFLGLPYVSVSAHARRIQKGLVFSTQQDGERATDLATAETAK